MEVFKEGFIRHPERTIIGHSKSDLILKLLCPVWIIVSPWSLVLFPVPRVPQFDKSDCLVLWFDVLDVEDTVGVACN